MKKLFSLLLCCSVVLPVFSQTPQVDSLNELLAATKTDIIKVDVLCKLSFYDPSFQHGLDLAQEGLALSRKIGYQKGEANCLHQVGNQYWTISNFPMALHYYLESIKIRELIHDDTGMAVSLFSIGNIYQEQEDFKNALTYFRRAISSRKVSTYREALLNSSIGFVYAKLNHQDSALFYYQRSYELFNNIDDKYQFNYTLNGLADLQLGMGNKELAMGYYRQAIRNGNTYHDTLTLSTTYLGISKLYEVYGEADSSIAYVEQALFFAQTGNVLKNIIEAGQMLSKLYQGKNDKEALRYLRISQSASDSLNSRNRLIQLQNMFFNETQRENELAEKEKKDEEQRKLNLEYAAIALGIIVFISLFLLLSHSIIANEKWISFLGVLGLLVVFEFINLLLHPALASITGDSPLPMLAMLVVIASLIIPIHHRLEKWVKEKMVEKNKRIRLAAAKKTIEKLESKK